MSIWKKYGFGWLVGGFFLLSIVLHWLFAWYAYVGEQLAHGQPIETSAYLVEVGRQTFENWQSEFLQLLFQVIGLTFLLFVGCPASKEEDDRLEEKLDAILRKVDPDNAERLIKAFDERFPGRYVGPTL